LHRIGAISAALIVGGLVFQVVFPIQFFAVSAISGHDPHLWKSFVTFLTISWAFTEIGLAMCVLPILIAFTLLFRSPAPRKSDFILLGVATALIPFLLVLFLAVISGLLMMFAAGIAALLAGAAGGFGAWYYLHKMRALPNDL
jgi:hypothetical protein